MTISSMRASIVVLPVDHIFVGRRDCFLESGSDRLCSEIEVGTIAFDDDISLPIVIGSNGSGQR